MTTTASLLSVAPTAPLVAASLGDVPLVLLFLVAAIIRLVQWVREKKKKAEEEARAEGHGAPQEPPPLPAPVPTSTAPRTDGDVVPDPWRRAPVPAAPRPPPRPAQRPTRPSSIRTPESVTHKIVGTQAQTPTEKKHGKTKDAPSPPPEAAARLHGRALLLGNHKTVRDRVRAAVLWREVLAPPRRMRAPRR